MVLVEIQPEPITIDAEPGSYRVPPSDAEIDALAQSYLTREDEDWTFIDPEDIKRLARAVLARK